jgi:two-component system sensor histidine kinase KdpD
MDLKRTLSYGGGYPFAVVAVCGATAVLLPLRSLLATPVFMLLLVPVIILIARVSGVRPSATAAVLAFLLLDFLFIPPFYRLTVASLSEWIGLLVFLIVALVSGQQTGQLRRREQAAVRRQSELELLNRLSFSIASEKTADATAELVVSQVAEVLDARRAALYIGGADAGRGSRCLAAAGETSPVSGEEALVAWVLRTSKGIGMPPGRDIPWDQRLVSVGPSEAIPGVVAQGVYLPLQTSTSLEGVLVVVPASPGPPSDDDVRLLAAVANLAASSIERQHLEEQASHAEALREADRLKSTLVSSVSHELKTPLAAATARVTGLIEEGEGCDAARVQQELTAVAGDLDRLNDSIGDLLDLSRLESDAWQPHFEPHDLRDVLGTVLSRLSTPQRERVRFELAENLPEVRADFAQIARALSNLVENALAYSPPPAAIIVGAQRHGEIVEVAVTDVGPGVPDAEKARIFEKFYRGSASGNVPSGTGLGLAIAREIVRTHDGTLRVEDVDPHGACFVLTVPVAHEEAE